MSIPSCGIHIPSDLITERKVARMILRVIGGDHITCHQLDFVWKSLRSKVASELLMQPEKFSHLTETDILPILETLKQKNEKTNPSLYEQWMNSEEKL